MALQVDWTESALADLEQIVRYIAVNDVGAAKQVASLLIERVEQVASFPRSGRVVPELNRENLREIVLTPNRIVYEYSAREEVIRVLRVWHAARGQVEI